MIKMWYCLGGPLHGTYQPAGHPAIFHRPPTVEAAYYYNGGPVPTVVIPHPPVTYYSARIQLPGWRFRTTAYVDEALSYGSQPVPNGTVLPGGIQGAQLGAVRACRWCYRAAVGQMPVCTRDECISALGWLESIDSWRWTGDH